MGWIYCSVLLNIAWLNFVSVALALEVLGGPAQPPPQVMNTLDRGSTQSVAHIENIFLEYSNPFFSLFLEGYSDLDCLENREYEIQETEHLIIVIPKLVSTIAEENCRKQIRNFRDRVLNLDIPQHSTIEIRILDLIGWKRFKVQRDASNTLDIERLKITR